MLATEHCVVAARANGARRLREWHLDKPGSAGVPAAELGENCGKVPARRRRSQAEHGCLSAIRVYAASEWHSPRDVADFPSAIKVRTVESAEADFRPHGCWLAMTGFESCERVWCGADVPDKSRAPFRRVQPSCWQRRNISHIMTVRTNVTGPKTTRICNGSHH